MSEEWGTHDEQHDVQVGRRLRRDGGQGDELAHKRAPHYIPARRQQFGRRHHNVLLRLL